MGTGAFVQAQAFFFMNGTDTKADSLSNRLNRPVRSVWHVHVEESWPRFTPRGQAAAKRKEQTGGSGAKSSNSKKQQASKAKGKRKRMWLTMIVKLSLKICTKNLHKSSLLIWKTEKEKEKEKEEKRDMPYLMIITLKDDQVGVKEEN
ncbi:(Dimethylallyl)adenosine tRNAmethylthiotransferase MiaB [Striga asiatica]|uniref:(Dimethylallyl)adenosine tRNAmethylthiotransferase MiaB n=1 Tax=Striga asiatica TaxID=4170 RepID=A0A5A7NZ50_STRAF|nr:(Dimethylallyl)adenosine tRNAmethylthiotransferase MiaB [Striga asiatica]